MSSSWSPLACGLHALEEEANGCSVGDADVGARRGASASAADASATVVVLVESSRVTRLISSSLMVSLSLRIRLYGQVKEGGFWYILRMSSAAEINRWHCLGNC